MNPEVEAALVQLRREIEILTASVLARARLAAPEILTPQRISVGSARAAIRASDMPAPPPPEPPPAAQRAPLAPPVSKSRSSLGEILARVIAFVRRLLRVR